MQLGRSPVSMADLLKAQLLRPGQEISFRRSTTVTGEVTAAGTVRFRGTEYSSPSTAGKVAAGGTSTNGWLAWHVRDGAEWTTLSALRDRLRGQAAP